MSKSNENKGRNSKMQWTQNLCRTCGQISETCHSIYEYNSDVPSILEDKLRKYLNLDLCKSDYKPKQMCNNCVMKLNEFSEFLEVCYATNQKFESIYFSSQSCQTRYYEHTLPQKQSVIVSNKQVPDNLDFELYKNTGIVLENLNITNCQLNETDVLELVGDGNYDTENCGSFVNNAKVRSPYTTVLRHPSNTDDCISSNYTCPAQNTDSKHWYMKYNNAQNQLSGEETNSKNIESVTKKTVSVAVVQNSVKLSSSKSPPKEKSQKPHSCPHCLKAFSRRGSLNSHITKHTNIRPYKCDDCSKTFPIKSELTTHKKIHGDDYPCTYCPKKFSVPSKLKRHIRIHTNDKPFVCNYMSCSKAFSDKRNLEAHKLLHTSEKKYSCTVCTKLFKTANRLKQHSKCHTSVMMYTCSLCLKRYKYKSNLISHIKKHNNSCPYCKVNCESKTVLTHHIKICRARL